MKTEYMCENCGFVASKWYGKCPECGGELVTKFGKNRTMFYSCENYPDCKFSSWDMPTSEKCPQCGNMLLRKKGKNQYVCRNTECGYKADAPEETVSDKE